jgi:CheY-like chemotaxis protein
LANGNGGRLFDCFFSIVHGGRLDPGVELLSNPYTREALARKIRHVLGNEAQHRLAKEQLGGAPATSTTAKLCILVVEDDPFIRTNTREILIESGHTVLEAGDAEAALDILHTEAVDVLLTDVGLPGRSGSELARAVRQSWPSVSIVFASGDDAGKTESGIGDAVQLSKPYSSDDLLGALERATAR